MLLLVWVPTSTSWIVVFIAQFIFIALAAIVIIKSKHQWSILSRMEIYNSRIVSNISHILVDIDLLEWTDRLVEEPVEITETYVSFLLLTQSVIRSRSIQEGKCIPICIVKLFVCRTWLVPPEGCSFIADISWILPKLVIILRFLSERV